MIRARSAAAALVLLLSVAGFVADSSRTPTQTSTTEGETPMMTELTWQEAKARTQAKELEIVNSIDEGKVLNVDQLATV